MPGEGTTKKKKANLKKERRRRKLIYPATITSKSLKNQKCQLSQRAQKRNGAKTERNVKRLKEKHVRL